MIGNADNAGGETHAAIDQGRAWRRNDRGEVGFVNEFNFEGVKRFYAVGQPPARLHPCLARPSPRGQVRHRGLWRHARLLRGDRQLGESIPRFAHSSFRG